MTVDAETHDSVDEALRRLEREYVEAVGRGVYLMTRTSQRDFALLIAEVRRLRGLEPAPWEQNAAAHS